MPRRVAADDKNALPLAPGASAEALPSSSPLPKKEVAYTNAKKLHELTRFARAAAVAVRRAGCEGALDVGCGKGRLGGVISSCYGIPVVGLEQNEGFVRRAEQRRAWYVIPHYLCMDLT